MMSNGWIPTTERLPDQREFIESYVRSAYKRNVVGSIPIWSINNKPELKVVKWQDMKT